MISAYLVHKSYFKTCKEALEYYEYKRTSEKKIVTTPSQRRYVYYYAHLQKHNLNYKPTLLLLTGFVMENIPSVNNETSCKYSILHLFYNIDYTSLQLPVGINNCRRKLFNNMTIFKKIVVSLDAVLALVCHHDEYFLRYLKRYLT